MHRSRIGVVLVDHPEDDWERGLAFWSGVQGVEPTGDDPYRTIGEVGSLEFASQRLGAGSPARVHIDIETDDVAAEVARVVGLGASVVADHGEHVVLEDPGGLVFCVVPVQTGAAFDRDARTWP